MLKVQGSSFCSHWNLSVATSQWFCKIFLQSTHPQVGLGPRATEGTWRKKSQCRLTATEVCIVLSPKGICTHFSLYFLGFAETIGQKNSTQWPKFVVRSLLLPDPAWLSYWAYVMVLMTSVSPILPPASTSSSRASNCRHRRELGKCPPRKTSTCWLPFLNFNPPGKSIQ